MNEPDGSDEKAEELMRAEGERLSKVGLDRTEEKISLAEGFELAKTIAEQRRVPPYKTEARFVSEMRKFRLTIVCSMDGKAIREWMESSDPEMPIVGNEEVTSAKAVAELFKCRVDQRRKLDRQRKSAKSKKAPNKTFKKVMRKSSGKKRNAEVKKRT